jgi:transposase InsO family protein
MGSRLRNGTPFRVLNIVDEFTREALACHVDRSISSADVIAELTRLFAERGKPETLRSDNGREFIAATLVNWLVEQGVTAAFIEKGSPQQNAFVERFNGTMRDELLKW